MKKPTTKIKSGCNIPTVWTRTSKWWENIDLLILIITLYSICIAAADKVLGFNFQWDSKFLNITWSINGRVKYTFFL